MDPPLVVTMYHPLPHEDDSVVVPGRAQAGPTRDSHTYGISLPSPEVMVKTELLPIIR